MDAPAVRSPDVSGGITEIDLEPYEEGLSLSAVLSIIASSLFVFVFIGALIPLIFAIIHGLREAPTSTDLPLGISLGILLLLFSTVSAIAFIWPWSLARMWRPGIVGYPLLIGLFVVSVVVWSAIANLQQYGSIPSDAITYLIVFGVASKILPSIIPILLLRRIFVDSVRLVRIRGAESRLLISAKSGFAGTGQVFAAALGIHPVCSWIPGVWRRVTARCFFVLESVARGFAIGMMTFFGLFGGIYWGIIGSAICLAIGIPTAAILRNLARRFARVSVENLTSNDKRQPILFLRSFRDDQVRLERRKQQGWFNYLVLKGQPTPTLDHVLLEEGTPLGPVIAIGVPGAPPPFGAARTFVSDDEWQKVIAQIAKTARAIIIVIDETKGVAWELMHIRNANYPEKTLYLFPPACSSLTISKFLYRYLFNPQDERQKIVLTEQLARPCIGWYLTSEGKVVLLTHYHANVASYVTALRLFQAYLADGYVPVGRKPEYLHGQFHVSFESSIAAVG